MRASTAPKLWSRWCVAWWWKVSTPSKPCSSPRKRRKRWNAFSRVVTPAFRRIKTNAETIATLAQLRDTLLPKLISGELRVKDAEAFLKERGL